ncbi:MAG: dTDP-4-dehydrorhamnose 3,5-epimerase family protein [bacterium]
MIDGVHVKKLRFIKDERGKLMEVLRKDDPFYSRFGQAYVTTARPGVVKAWHYHKLQDDNIALIRGKVRLGLYDAREGSKTRGEVMELLADEENPLLVHIPAGVYHGFKGLGNEESMVMNVPTVPYNHKNPDEFRIDPFDNDIPFDWRR